jgi:MoaA/NifB/PqqE/SkfB family radical SAM enzyme
MADFANILFAGPCNRACPFCIGHQVPAAANQPNLDVFPPRGLEKLIAVVNEQVIPDVVLTGTTSDPQLYRHERELVALLRERLHAGARLSVHTNGARALRRMEVFNLYDRACLSLPSLDPEIYERMMGSRQVPDLEAILRAATIPVKVSAVVNEHNVGDLPRFMARAAELGVRRFVVRQLFGDTRRWPVLEHATPVCTFAGNPVYDFRDMEVTVWSFAAATTRSVNLFADGTLGTEYLLTETRALGLARRAPAVPDPSVVAS